MLVLGAFLLGLAVFLALPTSWNLALKILISFLALALSFPLQIVGRLLIGASRTARINHEPRWSPLRALATQLYLRQWGGLTGGTRLLIKSVQVQESVEEVLPQVVSDLFIRHLRTLLPKLLVIQPDGSEAGAGSAAADILYASIRVIHEPRLGKAGFVNLFVTKVREQGSGDRPVIKECQGFCNGVSFGFGSPQSLHNAVETLSREFSREWLRLNG